jgi:heme O synthase-like polyprenyltransferase
MIKSKLKNRNLSQEDVFNFSELFKLMKPRVMSLVIFTCAQVQREPVAQAFLRAQRRSVDYPPHLCCCVEDHQQERY